METKREQIVLDDGTVCRIRQEADDDMVFVRYVITGVKMVLSGTFAEIEKDIIATYMVITERLMRERNIRYTTIFPPDKLSGLLSYGVALTDDYLK